MKTFFKIRPAKNHDAKQIYQFLCEKEQHLFDFKDFEVNYRLCISGTNNIYLVSVDERNEATGFISCHGQTVLHRGGAIYEIRELFIERKYRKVGIGRLLLKELEMSLTKRDYFALEVTIENKRKDLMQFYKNCGFGGMCFKMVKSKPEKLTVK